MVKDNTSYKIDGILYKYRGIINFDKIYHTLLNQLKKDKYDVYETKYKQKGPDNAYEVEINWTIEKEVTQYLKHEIKIKMFLFGPTIPVKSSNSKENLVDTRFALKINATLVTDYAEKWKSKENSLFQITEKVETFMKKIILKYYLSSLRYEELKNYCYSLLNITKKIINSETQKTGFN